ncbi:baseplate J/gp47 family protein [Solirubrobacter ginsenosidimutans]|uniref:Baseplate J/gp47 family protein n=1 Tax=Solirubrobacter ginsenosidimutans TaxID=490573 RepID=A0A9X3N1U1_9ACTN|nr:baseplate J/gp47 family protein [Solirubrobacter ginsenosidimutans]MDA0166825.1 baseplate J/gp47 family protein [Solirubrobacter ginsenosidimutans]
MIDPGHPFSVAYADVIAALEQRLRDGTEQPARWRFVHQSTVTAYELPREAEELTSVSALAKRAYKTFVAGTDYVFTNNRLVWRANGARPDEAAKVDVEYIYRERPAGLTDFNEGSVAGTLVRAVARELKNVYEQMDAAYRRAFIDIATDVALDNVVALLGIIRNPAVKARGHVIYVRPNAASQPVVIPAGSRVADTRGKTFLTVAEATIDTFKDEFETHAGGVVHTSEKIATVLGIWPRSDAPNPATTLATKPTTPQEPFGADERTITLADGVRPKGELRIRYAPKSVTVEVEAAQPGPEGDVNAGTVTVMPTPPAGISGVTNEQPIEGGRLPEPDDQLRERARHALERAGNATLDALRFAVLGIEGIDEVEVSDHQSDDSLPLGDVRVRYSASGDLARVRLDVAATIEATRAAGIRVVADMIETVLVSGVFYLIPDVEPPPGITDRFVSAVLAEFETLRIGAPLSVRRLSALAFQIGGLADVAEAQLDALGAPAQDPLTVGPAQRVQPDEANLRAVLLAGLRLDSFSTSKKVTSYKLQLVDAGGNAMNVRGTLALDLDVEIAAVLKTAPDQPPQHIDTVAKRLELSAGPTATVAISVADAPNFRADQHLPQVTVTISAKAFPGLSAVKATADFS